MENKGINARLYPVSALGSVLKIARERACQPKRRTKQSLSEALGISVKRLSGIEDGTAECTLDLAIEWCDAVEDYTAKAKIMHMFDLGLPATNPLLTDNPLSQLLNFKRQAEQAIEATEKIMNMSIQLRPGECISGKFEAEFYRLAEEVLDMKQATEITLESMRIGWGLDRNLLRRNWVQEALADGVLVTSVTHYEEIKREKFFSERAATL